MTPRELELVHATFTRVEDTDALAAMFYRRLFALEPSLRSLFKGDMEDQGQKLVTTLAMAVNGLRKLELLAPALEMLGRRHVAYGVKDEHYPIVRRALVDALAESLGDTFTNDARAAWENAYDTIAGTMRRAAAGATVA